MYRHEAKEYDAFKFLMRTVMGILGFLVVAMIIAIGKEILYPPEMFSLVTRDWTCTASHTVFNGKTTTTVCDQYGRLTNP